MNQRDALTTNFDAWFGMDSIQKNPIHLYAITFQEVLTVDNVSKVTVIYSLLLNFQGSSTFRFEGVPALE